MRTLYSDVDMGLNDIIEVAESAAPVHGQTEPLNLPYRERNRGPELVASSKSVNGASIL